jgi:hypothetical protein
MANTQSIRLTQNSLNAIRVGDSFGGRVNQIIDRYLEMLSMEHDTVLALFSDAEWAAMAHAVPVRPKALPAAQELVLLVEGLTDFSLIERLRALEGGELFTLIEMLEVARLNRRPPTR